ncbi:MAG: molybdopterin-dependent oxidoreductase [Acidimicrobiia bacterium]|nr:molybdopterin-dependent oxidoreductase [Acidimicrobiia bacterium]
MTRTTNLLTHWGPFRVTSDGSSITDVVGHPADPDPSPLGQGLLANDQCRVARPAIRRSWLEGGPGTATERRGSEPFVEVPWDEALDLVAGELRRVADQHGHQSIYGGSYGWGSAGLFHQASNQTRRFFRLLGPFTDGRLTYSSAAAASIVPYVFGLGWYPACGQQTAWSVIVDRCELFVSFGGLRLNNTQVFFGGQGPHHTREWIAKAAANGVSFVNVGPVRDDEATETDGRWLPIRPGTDVALMAALIHTLVVDDRADEEFLATYCGGWPRLKRYLVGETDGVAKTAAWASTITGIAADEIVALAREMATKRTTVNLGFAVQRADHGEQTYWMATALAAALGEIGLPGGGVAFPFGAHGRAGAGQPMKRVPKLPLPPPPDGQTVISVSRVAELLERPGEPYQFDGEDGTFPDIRLVYWVGGNVFHHHQDLNRLVRAWQRPETIVVHEPFWNPMAKRADIVLPATTAVERSDLGDGETMLVATDAAVPAHGEARDDYDIFAALADRLGIADAFTEGRTSEQWLRHLYEQFRAANDYAPPFEDFWAAGTLDHADLAGVGHTDHVFLGAFRADPAGRPLPTPSGKIELFSERIAGFGYDDCPGHPTWLEPYERLGTPAADRHPLHLVSNQPTTRLHSQHDHSAVSRDAKVADREPIRLHPDDAAARGIGEGDVVRVFNDRGSCLAGARISDAVAPGIAQLATGAWFDPDEDGTCKHGNPNVLTRDKGTSRLGQGPTAHTCLVEVEQFDGEPTTVTAFDPPTFTDRPQP